MRCFRMLAARGILAASVMTLCACTYGAPSSIAADATSRAITVDINLSAFALTKITAGTAAGYSPAQLIIPVGTQIRFVNTDSFAHTASAVGGSTFPQNSVLSAGALTASASGFPLSGGGWSSGNLAAGAASPVFVADKPGTYLFGCFYHYAAPMRGAIVVR